MEALALNIPKYPMLRFVVRHGAWLSVAFALAVLVCVSGAGVAMGSGVLAAAGPVLAVLVFILVRTLVEMVTLIADMLLPKP